MYWLRFVLALWMLGLTGCAESDRNSWLEPPEEAPDFSLETLGGETVSLTELRGHTVVIDFWATWCPPCVDQIPVLNRFSAERSHQPVRVLGVAVDAEGREIVAPFAVEHEIAYSVLLGDEGLAQRYGALGFPALFVITPSGGIDSVHFGVISLDELRDAVDDAQSK